MQNFYQQSIFSAD